MIDERKKRKPTPLAPALMEVVTDKGAVDAVLELGEFSVDQLVDNDVLREIPFVGAVLGLTKAGVGIRDYLFLKKLARFLTELDEVSPEKRNEFSARIASDTAFCERVGEKVLLLLERSDDMEKPAIVGKAFAAFLEGYVDLEQFTRMSTGIDRALLADLRKLPELQYDRINEAWGANLVPSGLVVPSVSQLIGGNSTSYPLTEAGKLVKHHCLR